MIRPTNRHTDIFFIYITMYFFQEKCLEVGHSTPDMAADIALRARANLLVLFHLSPRYKNIGDILKKVRKKYFVYKDYKLYFLKHYNFGDN